MRRIRLYDSTGALRYGYEGDEEKSEFIEEMYRDARLRLLVDTHGSPFRLICYFRAFESANQRSEQFYAVLEADSRSDLDFGEFRREVVEKVEEVFHEVDLSNPTTDAFEHLDEDLDASRFVDGGELSAIQSLIGDGEKLTFGSESQIVGLSLIKEVVDLDGVFVIADTGRSSHFSDAELVLDTGFDGGGLAPSKDTKDKIDSHLASVGKSSIDRKIDSIESELRDLNRIQRSSDVGKSEVEKPLIMAIDKYFPDILSAPQTEKPRGVVSEDEVGSSGFDISSTSKDVLDKSSVGLAVIAVILLFVVGGIGLYFGGFFSLDDEAMQPSPVFDFDGAMVTDTTFDGRGVYAEIPVSNAEEIMGNDETVYLMIGDMEFDTTQLSEDELENGTLTLESDEQEVSLDNLGKKIFIETDSGITESLGSLHVNPGEDNLTLELNSVNVTRDEPNQFNLTLTNTAETEFNFTGNVSFNLTNTNQSFSIPIEETTIDGNETGHLVGNLDLPEDIDTGNYTVTDLTLEQEPIPIEYNNLEFKEFEGYINISD